MGESSNAKKNPTTNNANPISQRRATNGLMNKLIPIRNTERIRKINNGGRNSIKPNKRYGIIPI